MSVMPSHAAPGEASDVVPEALEQLLAQIRRYPLLSPADEVRLAKRVERGDREARNRLITANLRLVVYVARRFRSSGVQLVDLVQEGTLGLISAVDRYDWRRGYRFSTYATWWIYQAVQRAIQRAGAIRVPARVAAEARELRLAESRLLMELRRQPTTSELAEHTGLTRDRLRELNHAHNPTISLDEQAVASGTLRNTMALTASLEDEVVARTSSRLVRRAMRGLPSLEREIICLRFGIGGGAGHSIALVAEHLGIGPGRVRTLERAALRRLARSDQLAGLQG